MPSGWSLGSYEQWRETCDTLHAHTQVLGKLSAALAAPQPQFQHAALRLSARGWETAMLPAADGSGGLVVALDLLAHEVVVEHTAGRVRRIPLTPDRPVGEVTVEVLGATAELGGAVQLDLAPAEVPWSAPLDTDHEHARYDRDQVSAYLAAATRAAFVLGAFRAEHSGQSTPVNAWWGSFDLAVSIFLKPSADQPPGPGGTQTAPGEQELAVGWWPGDARHGKAAFYAYASPPGAGFADADLSPARWEHGLGEYVLDLDQIRSAPDPHAVALNFARSALDQASRA
jgi:hypothetical protein